MSDKTEFANTILEHQALIYKAARVYTNTKEDRQDLYQEIVFQLWKSWESFQGNAKISTWMYRVAMNTAISFLNKEKKMKYVPVEDTNIHLIAEQFDEATEIRTQKLYDAIHTLGITNKGIVFLFLEGKSYREIADVVGLTESNISTRMLRIKEKLRTKI